MNFFQRVGQAVRRGASRVALRARALGNRVYNAVTGRRNLQLAGRIGRNRSINSMGVRSGN